jgi:hypothetical protein
MARMPLPIIMCLWASKRGNGCQIEGFHRLPKLRNR